MNFNFLPRLVALGCFALILNACSHAEEKSQAMPETATPRHLANGKKFLAQENYTSALNEFEAVLTNQTTSIEVPLALFYSAVALQELKDYPAAIERFRKFASGMSPQDARLAVDAFYRLGLCYEALDKKGEAIAAYLDAINRSPGQSTLRVELQARLAGLYAQMGNQSDAEKLYETAEKDLLQLRRRANSNEPPTWLGPTLYNMGKMSIKPLSSEDFSGSLKSYERAQVWLLKVTRLNEKKHSALARDEIIKLYTDAWKMIDSIPLQAEQDNVLALKQQQDEKIAMAVVLYNLLSLLKMERGYDYNLENKFERSLFEGIENVDNALEKLLRSRPVEQGLTPDAQLREGIKRRGRLIDLPKQRKK